MKKLKKSDKKIFLGVCGGIAEYFKADPTLVRIIVIILAVLLSFIPIAVIYLCAAVIMPDNDDIELDAEDVEINDDEPNTGNENGKSNGRSTSRARTNKKNGESQNETHRSDQEFNSYFEK